MKLHIYTGTLAIAIMAATVLAGFVLPGKSEAFASDQIVEIPEQTVTETVEIPNPWVECQNIEDAEKTAGFGFFFASEDFGKNFKLTGCRTIPQILLEADYSDGEQIITVRQAPGTNDISGDYNCYDTEEEYVENSKEGSIKVTLRKNGDLVYSAIFTDGENSFSIYTEEGISEDAVRSIVKAVEERMVVPDTENTEK